MKEAIFDRLIEKNEFTLPDVMIANEQEHMKEQKQEAFKKHYHVDHAPDMPLDEFRKGAERRVALSLIMSKLIEQHDVKVDEAKVDQLLDERFKNMGNVDMMKNYFKSNEKFMEMVNVQALELQVVDMLTENVALAEEEKAYFAFMRGEDEAAS